MYRSCERFLRALPEENLEAWQREGETASHASAGRGSGWRARMDLILTDITDNIRIMAWSMLAQEIPHR